MSWKAASELGDSLLEPLLENEKVEKFLSGVAPKMGETAVSALTGSDAAGKVTGAAIGGLSRSHGKAVARVVGSIGLAVVVTAAGFVATPYLVGSAIFELGKTSLKS